MSHRLSRIIPGILLALSAACQDQVTNPALPLDAAKGGGKPPSTCPGLPSGTSAVVLSPPASEIGVGGTTTLVARNQDGVLIPVCALKWSSSDLTIATVTNAGAVLGVAIGGPVTIKAQTSGRKPLVGTAFVTVGPAIAAVEVASAAAQVPVGGTVMLTATAKDADGNVITRSPVTWASGDPAVANVGADGTVTGVASGGPVTITATVEGVAGTAQVTVAPLVASVTLSPATATVPTGQTLQLTATAKDAHDVTLPGLPVSFTSSDPAVASVSATGLVTVHAAGAPVTITATIEGVTGTALVTITIPVIAGVELRQVVPDGQGGFYASGILRSQTTIAGKLFTPVEQPDGMVLHFNGALEPQWAVQVAAQNGPWYGQYGECCALSVSPLGTVYATGTYKASANVVHMGGVQTFTSAAGNLEGFVIQLSLTGHIVSWAHFTGGAFTEALEASAVDEAGNLYISGNFNGCCGAPGAAVLTTSSGSSLTVNAIGVNTGVGFKLSPQGGVLWAVRAGARDASFGAVAYDPVSQQVVFTSAIDTDGTTATLIGGTGGATTIACNDGCVLITGVNSSDGSYRWHTTASQPTWRGSGMVGLRVHGGKLYALMSYTGGPWTLWSAGGGASLSTNSYSNTQFQSALIARYSTAGVVEALLPFLTTGELQPFLALDTLPGNELGVPFAFSGTLTFAGQTFTAASVHEGLLVRLSSGLQVLRTTRLTGPAATDNGLRAALVDPNGYLLVSGKAGAGSVLNASQVTGNGGFLTRLPPGAF